MDRGEGRRKANRLFKSELRRGSPVFVPDCFCFLSFFFLFLHLEIPVTDMMNCEMIPDFS